MDWEEPVSVDSFSTIERILNCNVYLLNADELPVLNTTVALFHSLMYNSEFQFNVPQCWLLFHDEHFDAISKPKGFLACKYFCQKCCSCFSHNKSFQNHGCNQNIKENIAKLSKVETGPIYKDAGHYLQPDICKGSKEELKRKIDKCKNPSKNKIKKIIQQINNPRYIVYDFETDTHTNIHKPNLCEVTILNVSNDHDYRHSKGQQLSFEGYNCANDFCNWLFSEENSDSTVFAHNQSGYDAKFL